MKKRISILLFIMMLLLVLLPACEENTNIPETSTLSNTKDVIFRNTFRPLIMGNDDIKQHNYFYYNSKEIEKLPNQGKDALYAFVVRLHRYESLTEEDKNELFSLKETAKYNQKLYEIETRIAKDALIEKGFTILEDYPHTCLQVMNDKVEGKSSARYESGHCVFVAL